MERTHRNSSQRSRRGSLSSKKLASRLTSFETLAMWLSETPFAAAMDVDVVSGVGENVESDCKFRDSSSRAYRCFGGFMDGRMSTRDRAPHARAEASNRHSEVNALDNFRWLLCIDRWSCHLLEADEATFEREMEGLPSTRSAIDIPAELHCPLCKGVMKDAVMTGKCCYRSFCDKCIRDCIISKSMCACGATNILADDLVPNKNVRDLLESCQLAKPPLPSHSADLRRKREIEHIIERCFLLCPILHPKLI
ncbi:hypothetical protein Syun_029233 [Stephania yunnanensis]|uniref:RING-type domain-containing protein n=1 Tax=Stephania yunnanensis TaxID=152371 RepID=A0AAP0E576_9MAGN